MIETALLGVLTHPNMDPVALNLGPLSIHWYGLMYLAAFVSAWFIAKHQVAKPWSLIKAEHLDDMIFYAALGVVLGGRVGYVFFYNFPKFLEDPIWLFKIWEGGMSFHGGFLGVLLAMFLYSRKLKIPFGAMMDLAAVMTPLGLGFGRLGNFIGQELWGRASDVPWAMIFPKDPSGLARHPSQLYQAGLEGLLLFVIVFIYSNRERPNWATAGVFAMGYGIFRFLVEFVREPDAHLGIQALGMTRGQMLSLPMILVGIALLWYAYNRQAAPSAPTNKAGKAKANKK
jgi:phosphatidylglycerol:prolipoprotein diacylglycerol transferase